MVRIALSFIASMILFYIESMIVMFAFGFNNGIEYNNFTGLFIVWGLNFFLSYSILTELTPWFMRVNKIQIDEEEETSAS